MPVLSPQGFWHEVTVWNTEARYALVGLSGLPGESGLASSLTNVIEWPRTAVGMQRFMPVEVKSPGSYWNCEIWTVRREQSRKAVAVWPSGKAPPWLLSSARWPWVTW